MTRGEIMIAMALRHVSFPAGDDKNYAKAMTARAFYRSCDPLTAAESEKLHQVAHRYRHQLPAEVVRLL